MKLEHWSVVMAPSGDPYRAPEDGYPALHGRVSGHPRFPDGEEVTTSRIQAHEGGKIRTSSGSLYELGEVDPVYESKFPNARERLIASLQ